MYAGSRYLSMILDHADLFDMHHEVGTYTSSSV
jgi:hypothetical protein